MERILLVDDDTRILSAYQRQLRSHFNVTTALGPEKAFKEIEKSGHFSVVVSDFRMPKMDGITFLNEIRLRNPETIRVMLTGFADQQTAIDCINENRIFRFLTKPYPAKDLIQVLDVGLKQYRLVQAEKELLENTLNGAIKTLTEVLSMAEPRAFGKAERIRSRVKELAKQLEVEDIWEIEIAAMLSQIGRISIPGPLSIKMDNEEIFTGKELDMIARIPEAGRDLIRNIPRLENVAEMVYYQTKNYDGSGFPADSVTGESIPFGARILKVLIDLIDLEVGDISTKKAIERMKDHESQYDPTILNLAETTFTKTESSKFSFAVQFHELLPGQLLVSDVETRDDMLIVSAGHRVSPMLLQRLRNFANLSGIKEPIYVEKAV